MSSEKVIFQHVVRDSAEAAYQWHRGFTGAQDFVTPQSRETFSELAEKWRVVCAMDDHNDYIAIAYFTFNQKRWVIGGLSVHNHWLGTGVAWTVVCLTLGHVLFEEDPLSRGEKVIAHVARTNKAPRSLLNRLAFQCSGSVQTSRGEFDEFSMSVPKTLEILAQWTRQRPKKLKEGTIPQIRLRKGITFKKWNDAFLEMARGANKANKNDSK